MLDFIIGAIVICIFSAIAFFLMDNKWAHLVAISLGGTSALLMFFTIIIVLGAWAVGGLNG